MTDEETEEEKKAREETEEEVSVQREKFVCVVHKGPIEGDNYLCSRCFTFYCLKCAKTLKKQGENCWTCGAEFKIKSGLDISSDILDEVQKLEDKRNSLKKTAINLDESFYAGAIETEDYRQMKDKLVEFYGTETAHDITWWANDNGDGTSWTEHIISSNFY